LEEASVGGTECVEGGEGGISTTFFPLFPTRGCSLETVTFGSSATHFRFPFPSSELFHSGFKRVQWCVSLSYPPSTPKVCKTKSLSRVVFYLPTRKQRMVKPNQVHLGILSHEDEGLGPI